ncbi:transcriptional regulator with XRE-family HTH domain [Methylobacterium sp. RAS18]|nr:transcriptional regulator with XRE-family HTH domain [Methylobacterium sp. RAS18]
MFTAPVNGKDTASVPATVRLLYRVTEQTLATRVQQRLDTLGKSARSASLEAKLSDAFVLNILNGKSKSPRAENLDKLATVLGTTSSWLLRGEGSEVVVAVTGRIYADKSSLTSDYEGMPVPGEVAAGRWLAVDENVDESRYGLAPITPDPHWAREAQYGLIVRGTSINNFAVDGDILHCVDIAIAGLMPGNGDLVIVEQTRDGGHLRERTAKLYHVGENDMVELRADSADPRWDTPIYVPHRVYSHAVEPGLTVSIVAIVIGAYKPRQVGRRR